MLKSRLSLYDRERPNLPFFQYGFNREEFVNFLRKTGFLVEEVRVLYAHRLLLEEIAFYRWALSKPRGRFIRNWAESLLQNRDGHMLLVVGKKPVDNPWTIGSKSVIL